MSCIALFSYNHPNSQQPTWATYGRRSGGAGEHTVPAGGVAAHFRGRGICLCFADAKRRSDLERGRGDLAQLEIVVGTGENLGSFLQETEAITASYEGAG